MCICLKMTSVVLSDVNGLTPFDCSDGRLEFCHAGSRWVLAFELFAAGKGVKNREINHHVSAKRQTECVLFPGHLLLVHIVRQHA